MDDVDRLADHPGEHDRAPRRLALDRRGAALRVVPLVGLALLQELLLERDDRIAVLGVDGHERAEALGGLHHLDELRIVDADGPAVGHEGLERRDAVLARADGHLLEGVVTEPGDGHVEGVIGDRLLRLLVPHREPVEQRLPSGRDHEIDDRGRAPGNARRGAGLEIIGALRPHERQLHVHMGVDPAGEDELPRGVDHGVPRALLRQPRADRGDLPVLAVDVADEPVARCDDLAVLDQDAHVAPPRVSAGRRVPSGGGAAMARETPGERAGRDQRPGAAGVFAVDFITALVALVA